MIILLETSGGMSRGKMMISRMTAPHLALHLLSKNPHLKNLILTLPSSFHTLAGQELAFRSASSPDTAFGFLLFRGLGTVLSEVYFRRAM